MATARTTPTQFKVPGSYVSNFAPDISGIAADKAIIAGWKKDNPKSQLGSFGPPSYLATQVALQAIKYACTAGKGRSRTAARLSGTSSGSGFRTRSSAAASASRRSRTTR